MTYRLILISFFSLGIAFCAWSWLPASKNAAIVSTHHRASVPDAWMESVEATFMSHEGHILMKIHAPTVTHFADNDTTLLKTPTFLLYRNSPSPWRIQAGVGVATNGLENIRLSQTVTLHYPGDKTQPATWVNTDKLVIHPEQKTAETMEQVTLTQPNITVHGKGLHADLNSGDIKLLSETRGEYAINQ